MNVAFLLITFIVIAATIWCWVLTNRAYGEPWNTLTIIGALFGSLGSVVLVACSFGAALGQPITTAAPTYRIEQTPYRVVVTACGHEATFEDARTVQLVRDNRLTGVSFIMQRNAWGFTHEALARTNGTGSSIAPAIELSFRDADPSRQPISR